MTEAMAFPGGAEGAPLQRRARLRQGLSAGGGNPARSVLVLGRRILAEGRSAMDTETISVTLPAEIVRAIRDAVETGAYSSADAVVEDALLLQEDETETPEFAAYMREKIKESLQNPRPSVPIEEAFERLRRRHEERVNAARDAI